MPLQLTNDEIALPEESTEQKLQKAQQQMVGEVPLIPASPDAVIHLPRGLYNGKDWETEVELRELTGGDEESLARFKDPADFFNGVVVYGVARVGSTDLGDKPFGERSAKLAGLLIGEREQLFLHIARVTYGDEKEITHTCPFCNVDADTTLLLSEDVKIPEMEAPHTNTYSMTTAKGAVLTYRLGTGSDQMAVFDRKGANNAEQNTIMISRCVTQVNGNPVVSPLEMARSLSMGDRRKLLDLLINQQPSPDFNLKINCVSCGEEMTLPLGWQDIFRYQ